MSSDAQAARLAALQARIDDPALPPVHTWHPATSGEIDIRIAADGQWFHEGRAIRRERLVALFARILRREADGQYYLVTPIEKLRIQVDDAPFTAILLDVENPGAEQFLHFTTNTGERVTAGHANRVWLSAPAAAEPDAASPRPYLHVRAGLNALLLRSVYYQLMDHLETQGQQVGVCSDGCFMALGAP